MCEYFKVENSDTGSMRRKIKIMRVKNHSSSHSTEQS